MREHDYVSICEFKEYEFVVAIHVFRDARRSVKIYASSSSSLLAATTAGGDIEW